MTEAEALSALRDAEEAYEEATDLKIAASRQLTRAYLELARARRRAGTSESPWTWRR